MKGELSSVDNNSISRTPQNEPDRHNTNDDMLAGTIDPKLTKDPFKGNNIPSRESPNSEQLEIPQTKPRDHSEEVDADKRHRKTKKKRNKKKKKNTEDDNSAHNGHTSQENIKGIDRVYSDSEVEPTDQHQSNTIGDSHLDNPYSTLPNVNMKNKNEPVSRKETDNVSTNISVHSTDYEKNQVFKDITDDLLNKQADINKVREWLLKAYIVSKF